MKRNVVMIVMVLIVGLLLVSALAAEGAQEQLDSTNQAPAQRPYFNAEQVAVSGSVEFSAAGAGLKGEDGKNYELMYPRFLAEDVEIESGDTISVEGYLVPGPRWEASEDENYLRVEKVTHNGQEYNLASNLRASNFAQWSGPRGNGYRGSAYGPGNCRAYNGFNNQGGYAPNSGYRPGSGRPQGGMNGSRGPGMMGGQGYRW